MKGKNKPVSPRLKKLVKDSIRRHAWNIGVSHFKGDILYMDEDKEKESDHEAKRCIFAEVIVDRRYLTCTFRFYPYFIKCWEEEGDEFVEQTVAHEVAHIATEHMKDLVYSSFKDEGEVKDAWESLTERIGNMSVNIDRYNNNKKSTWHRQ